MRKLNKQRARKHMAKGVPDLIIAYISKFDVDVMITKDYGLYKTAEVYMEGALAPWVQAMKLKHGQDVILELESEYQIDYDRYKTVGRVIPKEK